MGKSPAKVAVSRPGYRVQRLSVSGIGPNLRPGSRRHNGRDGPHDRMAEFGFGAQRAV